MIDNDIMYYRDTWVDINLNHIQQNIRNLKEFLADDVQIMAVVKGNAYGHGDSEVARTALEAGATYLAVAFLDEALSLRNKGITAPILVLGAMRPEFAPLAIQHQITVTVHDVEWLIEAERYLNESSNPLLIHIKCDTGMGRLGVRTETELKQVESILRESKCFDCEGIYTHFATADELDPTYFKHQVAVFEQMLHALSFKPIMIHCGNSAAALRYPNVHFNAVRFGISMYGLSPSPQISDILPFALKPAFSLHSTVVQMKQIHKGDSLSYGATYTASSEEWIATIPVGYADGWLRKLSGQRVLVNGKSASIVGRICMDQCMIRLEEPVPIGTKVTLIGENGHDFISIDEIAKKLDTINYEVPCLIASRVPRIYSKEEKIIAIRNYLL